MPTVSAARGCSPTARRRRPQVVRKRNTQAASTSNSAIHVIRFCTSKTLPMPLAIELTPGIFCSTQLIASSTCCSTGMLRDVDVRDRRRVRRARVAVDVLERERRDARREDVDGGARDDLVGAQVDREDRVHEREQRAEEGGPDQPELPRARLVGAT